MKFNEFLSQVKSTGGVDTDGYYGQQCMDLYNYYCNNVLGIQNVGADCAKNILNNINIMNNVKRINNYPEFIPQKGDIAVWTGTRYGHVAICLGEGDRQVFKTIDQNWDYDKRLLTEEWHNYDYLGPIVFLRPHNQENIIEKIEEAKPNNGYPMTHKVGDKVRFSTCYISSAAPNSEAIPVSKMERDTGVITRIEKGAKNPYLLDDGLCWVNDGDIRETIVEETIIYARNNLVVYSHFFRGANDTNAVDCMSQYGSWQQRYIIDIVKGARNPYKLDNGLYLNNDAIKELK